MTKILILAACLFIGCLSTWIVWGTKGAGYCVIATIINALCFGINLAAYLAKVAPKPHSEGGLK